jgi:hypothetical protein
MDDTPFTVRMEPITECILPGGKLPQTQPPARMIFDSGVTGGRLA